MTDRMTEMMTGKKQPRPKRRPRASLIKKSKEFNSNYPNSSEGKIWPEPFWAKQLQIKAGRTSNKTGEYIPPSQVVIRLIPHEYKLPAHFSDINGMEYIEEFRPYYQHVMYWHNHLKFGKYIPDTRDWYGTDVSTYMREELGYTDSIQEKPCYFLPVMEMSYWHKVVTERKRKDGKVSRNEGHERCKGKKNCELCLDENSPRIYGRPMYLRLTEYSFKQFGEVLSKIPRYCKCGSHTPLKVEEMVCGACGHAFFVREEDEDGNVIGDVPSLDDIYHYHEHCPACSAKLGPYEDETQVFETLKCSSCDDPQRIDIYDTNIALTMKGENPQAQMVLDETKFDGLGFANKQMPSEVANRIELFDFDAELRRDFSASSFQRHVGIDPGEYLPFLVPHISKENIEKQERKKQYQAKGGSSRR
jgi:hypothetical protein